nr:hypothetical protein [uncultured Prevotella sp.]
MKYPNVEQVGSSTEAHEFGHSLGLWPGTKNGHPKENLLGKGQPGIMYPRGTIVDPQYRYNPKAGYNQSGGTLNPEKRKVLQSDIDMLHLDNLHYDKNGNSQLGKSTSAFWE